MNLSSADVDEKLVKECADELQVVFYFDFYLFSVCRFFELGILVICNVWSTLEQGKLDQIMVCYSDISSLSVDDLGNMT